MDSRQARDFEDFVSESGDALLRMATLLTADPDLAEDVYQETPAPARPAVVTGRQSEGVLPPRDEQHRHRPGASAPEKTARAFLRARPYRPARLPTLLIKQGQDQQAQAIAWEEQDRAKVGKKAVIRQPRLTDDDWAFDQATTLLWNPLVGPQLRAALYKVLAATSGVRVNDHARDDLGRPAVEISRTAAATGIEDLTFENPETGGVLETAFVYRDGTKGFDLYLSVTSSRTVPPNPYLR